MDSIRHPSATPAVSVVMPSFNQRAFIGSAVRSVMSQGSDDIELVVMDGGSTDGTLTELAALATAFPGRLRWFSGPDDGPADAIHRAVQAAGAPLIGWLNSDDLYAPNAVQRAVDYLSGHPADAMVYGHGQHIDGHGALVELYPTLPPWTPLQAFADGCFICQPTVFFRKAVFLALGGLDTTLRTAFDFDLWLKMFKAYPGRIGFIDAVPAH
jgi:glycosyltransferase involved in cell wall biosynthesis